GMQFLSTSLDLVGSLAVVTLLIAGIFKVLPDVEINWKDTLVGAVATAVLFAIGKFALGLYLAHGSTASAYGPAGSLAALLVWIYYSAVIVFFGAELTQVYANRYGSGVRPDEDAVPLDDQTRATQGMPTRPHLQAAKEAKDSAAAPKRPAAAKPR